MANTDYIRSKLKKISEYQYEIEKTKQMNVPGIIYGNDPIINELDETVLTQLTNVACLPGIQKAAFAMPDTHQGYGFPIGGVAAFDKKEGIISAGGVGYDINCGVRTLITNYKYDELKPHFNKIADALFRDIPAGLGSKGELRLDDNGINEVMSQGSKFMLEKGYATKEDLEFTEDNGFVKGAKPEYVSDTAIKREQKQIGSLGSGNHYLELQRISEVFDEKIAENYGLSKDQMVITIHCGSRALGHQICSDYIRVLEDASKKYKINLLDRQLACAPIESEEGKRYFGAMVSAINYAFANRQMIMHLTRESIKKVVKDMELNLLYDVAHNTCKIEKHKIDKKIKEVYVHRKGATRAFGPSREEIPAKYQKSGQPVIIGGSMGTASYILAGVDENAAFESTCHGAGRAMSRTSAINSYRANDIVKELTSRGIIIKGHSMKGLAEEAPEAYKDVNEVIEAVHNGGLSKKVVKMLPVVTIKG